MVYWTNGKLFRAKLVIIDDVNGKHDVDHLVCVFDSSSSNVWKPWTIGIHFWYAGTFQRIYTLSQKSSHLYALYKFVKS